MAKFNSAWLIHKQQFRSLTGIEPYTFLELVERLRPHWRERIEAPKNRSGRPWGVGGVEDHLLVLLILYRCAITQDIMVLSVPNQQVNHQPALAADRSSGRAGSRGEARGPRQS